VSRSGRVGLTVACPTGGLGGCRASLEVRTLAGGRRRSVRLGRAFTALIPGASRRLSVALSRGGRARLSPKGTRVVVLLRPDVHIAPVRQTLTLLPSPHTRR
jgi:hypothetical protein